MCYVTHVGMMRTEKLMKKAEDDKKETIMNNQEYLQEITDEINDILIKHNTVAHDIPESLMAYVVINNKPEMIETFLEDGFVAPLNPWSGCSLPEDF